MIHRLQELYVRVRPPVDADAVGDSGSVSRQSSTSGVPTARNGADHVPEMLQRLTQVRLTSYRS